MDLQYDDALLVYTSDAKAFRAEEVKALFEGLLRGSRPLVLFVHGRGDEPEKSLHGGGLVEGKAVSKLEAYGVAVVMFSWDSKRGKGLHDRERPLENMPAAAARFATVLESLTAAAATLDADHGTRQPVALLAHSMGTIVAQTYAQSDGSRWRAGATPLFSNVILSSADADDKGHEVWVQKIAEIEHLFVTVNPKDGTLKKSKEARAKGAHALGLDPGPTKAAAATYVAFKIDAHEIFTRRPEHPEISQFFARAFQVQ